MENDDSNDIEITPEIGSFLAQPMTRIEVVRLVQPLRAAVLSIFQGTMTSLALLALHVEDQEAKEKARKKFEELHDVFNEIDAFDSRLELVLRGMTPWDEEATDATNE